MHDALTWSLAVLSLAGVILNVRKHRLCFVLWMMTNASWAIVDYRAGLPAQAALQVVYFALSVWGAIRWSKELHHDRHR